MQNKYEKDEKNLLLPKIIDKQKMCETRNKVTFSDFLNQQEKAIIIKNLKLDNTFFFGGSDNSEREVLFFYPEKITKDLAQSAINTIITALRITLPSENFGKFEHKNYLSALMKIGINREKIGDIIVDEKGADIIVFNNNVEFIKMSLQMLTRFKKAKIEQIDIAQIKKKIQQFENRKIIVSSMRIDNIVSELANCSRNVASELIEGERVFINYELTQKCSKTVEFGDIVTIRGKGKFIIDHLVKYTQTSKLLVEVMKYI